MAGPGEAPPFWWRKPDWQAFLLWPLSIIYGLVATYRWKRAKQVKLPVSVICVGNLTVGGEGKTPIAIALGRKATELGYRPGFLSRGHGGSHSKPCLVDAEGDSARVVGDEPLLLARHAPVVVAANREEGAHLLIAHGCNLIIMDDGFQSAHLHMDFALIVVDAKRGYGNGHIIPAGPLRAPLIEQMRRLDGVVTMGKGDGADPVIRHASRAGKPVFAAAVHPIDPAEFVAQRVMAFAGIGNPDKFYETLRTLGADLVKTRSFPDHHLFSDDELGELINDAEVDQLALVTTEKDLVRIRQGMVSPERFTDKIRALPVEARFDDPQAIDRIIHEAWEASQQRILREAV